MTTRLASLGPPGNLIINTLPPRDRRALLAQLEPVSFSVHHMVFRRGKPIPRVYFPVTGVLSLVTTLRDGSTIEVSMIGREGTSGVPVFLGASGSANASCFSQVPGTALRMSRQDFSRAVERSPALRRVLLRYTSALLVQVGQAVACNRLHSTMQRCARWLLMTHDRVESDEFPLTHEFLSVMLGTRRASVTQAAGALQKAGLIRYRRGQMSILDRRGLERASCECYRVFHRAFQDVAGPER